MKKIDKILVYIKYFALSKYGYASIVLIFLIWMTFFDNNNFIKRWRLNSENSKLMKENIEYGKIIKDNELKINALSTDKDALEKYAREVYGMKSPDEDVFLFDE